jgi:hypothetical protein
MVVLRFQNYPATVKRTDQASAAVIGIPERTERDAIAVLPRSSGGTNARHLYRD